MQRRHWALEVLRKEGVRSVSNLSSSCIDIYILSFTVRKSISSRIPDLARIAWNEKPEGNGLM